jgi:hypothetical protein
MAVVICKFKEGEKFAIPSLHVMQAVGFGVASGADGYFTAAWTSPELFVTVTPGAIAEPTSLASTTAYIIPLDRLDFMAVQP